MPLKSQFRIKALFLHTHSRQLSKLVEVLQRGVDVDAVGADPPDLGKTALMVAAELGFVDGVDALLAHGADANTQCFASEDETGYTPLHFAAQANSPGAIRRLLQSHCQLNATTADGLTALECATRAGSVDAVKALVAAGADLESADEAVGPLVAAVEERRLDIVKLLVEAGANPGPSVRLSMHSALHTAASRGALEILRYLLPRVSSPNLQNYRGDTALHEAASAGRLECVRLLLEAGADVRIRNDAGHTPLTAARLRQSKSRVVELLTAAGG